MVNFTGWTFDYIYERLTWPRYQALVRQWNDWPPLTVSSARNVGMGPKPGKAGKASRKLIETGDPDFPYVYEATPEEMETLRNFGFGAG